MKQVYQETIVEKFRSYYALYRWWDEYYNLAIFADKGSDLHAIHEIYAPELWNRKYFYWQGSYTGNASIPTILPGGGITAFSNIQYGSIQGIQQGSIQGIQSGISFQGSQQNIGVQGTQGFASGLLGSIKGFFK